MSGQETVWARKCVSSACPVRIACLVLHSFVLSVLQIILRILIIQGTFNNVQTLREQQNNGL